MANFAREPVTPELRQIDQKLTEIAIRHLTRRSMDACDEAAASIRTFQQYQKTGSVMESHSICMKAICLLLALAALSGEPKYAALASELQNSADLLQEIRNQSRVLKDDDDIQEKINVSLEEAGILKASVVPVR